MLKQCLVVDDSHVVRRITSQLLSSMRFEPQEADSVRSALEACCKQMPDLVILDWSMPEQSSATPMTSLECIQAMRRLPGGTAPIVLYCTTEHDAGEFFRAVRAGASDVIVKPFDREMLRRKLVTAGVLGG